MIEVHNLNKSFGPQRALIDVNLRITAGEFVVLVGPNGAGKTTLLRILATLAHPTSGAVHIAGLDLAKSGAQARAYIGFLSHHTLLYADLNAVQNLRFYAQMYQLPQAEARIDELLKRVDLFTRRHDLVRTYSRGMLQRLTIARTVLHHPKLILLDEPYTGLDPIAADHLTALLTNLSAEGCTLVLTTHNLESAITTEKRGMMLLKGRVVADVPCVQAGALSKIYRGLINIPPPPPPPPAHVSPEPNTSHALPTPTHNFLRQIWAIIVKDIASELHTREIFNAMFVFAALTLLIFSFALDLRGAVARAAAPGVLWSSIAFAGTLGLSRSMAREQQSGGIEGLLLASGERSAIFLGKALGNLLMILAMECVLLPLATVMFNVSFFHGGVLLTVLLGTIGYTMAGTLLATIAVNTRAREVMLPILLLPLMVPLLIAAVQTLSGFLHGATWAEVNSWMQLLVVYDLIITAVAMVTFGYAVEE